MERFIVFYLSALSILLPLFAAAWRRDRIGRAYLPLIILLVAGAINEGISAILIFSHGTNLFNGNVYVLVEFILAGWLFRRLTPVGNRPLLNMVVLFAVLVWALDNLILHSPYDNNSLFRMVCSLLIVCISIDRLCLLLFFNEPSPIKVPDVLICGGFLMYHIYKMFVESYHVFLFHMHNTLSQKLWLIMCVINIIMHIVFTCAILCLPKKQTSIILS